MLLKMPLADYLSNQHDENYLYLISLLKNGSTRHIIESMIRELLASRAISLRATHLVNFFELNDDFGGIVDKPKDMKVYSNKSVTKYMNSTRELEMRFSELQCLKFYGGYVRKSTKRHENYFPIEFIQVQLNNTIARNCQHRWGPLIAMNSKESLKGKKYEPEYGKQNQLNQQIEEMRLTSIQDKPKLSSQPNKRSEESKSFGRRPPGSSSGFKTKGGFGYPRQQSTSNKSNQPRPSTSKQAPPTSTTSERSSNSWHTY